MKTTASRDHGKNGDLAVSDHLQKSRAIMLDQPLQLRLNVGGIGTSLCSDTHRAGKRDEIGVLLVGVRVSVLVEQILPKGGELVGMYRYRVRVISYH